jgi:hypothetical protein
VKCAIDITTGTSSCSVVDDAVYGVSQESGSGSDNQFDDVADFFMQDDVPLWQVSEDNENNIHQILPGNVGFNVSPGLAVENRGQISGAVRVQDDPTTTGPDDTEGRVLVDKVCTYEGADSPDGYCFPSSKIGGEDTDMACPDGEHIVGISGGRVECELDSLIEVRCPDGEIMRGIESDGTPMCDIPPPSPCDAQEFSICGEFQSTEGGTQNNGTSTIYGGANASATYRCQDGSWKKISSNGSCDCTPGIIKTTHGSCGTGYSGQKTTTVTRVCPSGETEQTVDDSECTCVPTSSTRNKNCPSGMNTGTIMQQRDWVCDANGNGKWTNWTTTSDTCGCTEETDNRTVSCGGNLHGSYRQQRTKSCPTGAWGSWTNIDNPDTACTCVPDTQQRRLSCPAGYDGEIIQTRDLTCGSSGANWTGWTETSNTCKPIPPRVCYWSSSGSATTSSTGLGDSAGGPCECGEKGPCNRRLSPSSYSNYTNCSCD